MSARATTPAAPPRSRTPRDRGWWRAEGVAKAAPIAHLADACLLEDDALGLAQGQLSESHCARALEHLDRCTACQEVTNEALHQIGALGRTSAGKGWLANFAPGMTLMQRYVIRRYIARGGMGEVYEADDLLLDESVALKTVVATACDSRRALGRLLAEVRLARSVTHPNVCRIYDLHQHTLEDGVTLQFMSMQLIRGQTLRQRLRAGLPTFAEVTSIARQVLSALTAVHQAGVLHCDLKSDNLMLIDAAPAAPLAMLTDFGLSQRVSASARHVMGCCASGSPPYMAPEQLRGDCIGEETDLYGLGVVLFEALTGQLPFGTKTSTLLAGAWGQASRPRAPSELRFGLNPALDDFVIQCLAGERAQRYPNARAALAELERALSGVRGSE